MVPGIQGRYLNMLKTKTLALNLLFALLLFTLTMSLAHAERVSVSSSFGAQGQGWLFGARSGGQEVECWVAVPAHVISSESSDSVAPFQVTDSKGYTSESAQPLKTDNLEGANQVLRESVDLAFAKIKGRESGSCLSRLGLPEMVYQSLLRKAPRVDFFDMLDTSFGMFSLTLKKVRVDALGGALLILGTDDAELANTHFSQGLSGAIGTVQWQSKQYPFAMAIRINASKREVQVVRFDVIQKLFELLETDEEGDIAPLQNYRILGTKIDPANSSAATKALSMTDECWVASPPVGETHVELLLETTPTVQVVRGVSLVQAEPCATEPVTYSVDQRPNTDSHWVRVGECESTETAANNCPMDLRAPRQLKISIGPVKQTSISALQLYSLQ